MSDRDLIEAALLQLLSSHDADRRTAASGFEVQLWNQLSSLGYSRIGIPESVGGEGGPPALAHLVIEHVAAYAAPLPLAEGWVAGWMCAASGLELPAGLMTFGPARPGDVVTAERVAGRVRVTARMSGVPWMRHADHIVLQAQLGGESVAIVANASEVDLRSGANVAGEPRDLVEIDTTVGADRCAPLPRPCDPVVLGAMVRSASMSGALRRATELTITHVRERVQFGRALESFQLVRQELAGLVGEVAASSVASNRAMATLTSSPDHLSVGAAKIRAARAAGRVAATAHQLHGAIGFTDEHVLHRLTTRLWSWRDECGTQAWWEEQLGRAACVAGPDQTWDWIVGESCEPAAG